MTGGFAFADAEVAGLAALDFSVAPDFGDLPQFRPALLASIAESTGAGVLGCATADAEGWADADSSLGTVEALGVADTVTEVCDETLVTSDVEVRDLSAASRPPARSARAAIAAPITSLRRGEVCPTPVNVPVALLLAPDSSLAVTPVRVT